MSVDGFEFCGIIGDINKECATCGIDFRPGIKRIHFGWTQDPKVARGVVTRLNKNKENNFYCLEELSDRDDETGGTDRLLSSRNALLCDDDTTVAEAWGIAIGDFVFVRSPDEICKVVSVDYETGIAAIVCNGWVEFPTASLHSIAELTVV